MHIEHHHWYSQRLNRELGIVVIGHWGLPVLTFPTSGGNEWEYHDRRVVHGVADLVEQGRIKFFCLNSNASDSFYNKGAHPLHRSWMQRMYDEYLTQEVVPFVHNHCRGYQPIATIGASLGAYYAVNTLLKHPDAFKRCYGLSGVYDMKSFMDGLYDENFYFNNPADYVSNLSDGWFYEQYRGCDIHLATGHGPWEHRGPTDQLSGILGAKGIAHSLDDWGPLGGHDWPYWTHQVREYLHAAY